MNWDARPSRPNLSFTTRPFLDTSPHFVQSFDFTSGLMTGDVNDYYQGQDGRSDDGGYPYLRKRLRKIRPSPGSRKKACRARLCHWCVRQPYHRLPYGVNGSSALFGTAAEKQYNVTLCIDPDGITDADISDQIGNAVGHVKGASGLPDGSLVSAVVYDNQDNPSENRPPNWFSPPSGKAADWAATGSLRLSQSSGEQPIQQHRGPTGHCSTRWAGSVSSFSPTATPEMRRSIRAKDKARRR